MPTQSFARPPLHGASHPTHREFSRYCRSGEPMLSSSRVGSWPASTLGLVPYPDAYTSSSCERWEGWLL
jgi:hypothetical protein